MPWERSADLGVEVCWGRGVALVIARGDLNGVSVVDLAECLMEIDKVLEVLNGQSRRLVVGDGFVNQAAVRALAVMRQRLSPECLLLLRSPSRAARTVLAPSGLLDDGYVIDGRAFRAPPVNHR